MNNLVKRQNVIFGISNYIKRIHIVHMCVSACVRFLVSLRGWESEASFHLHWTNIQNLFAALLDSGLSTRGQTRGCSPKWQLHSIKILLEAKGSGYVAISQEKSTSSTMEGGHRLCNHSRAWIYSSIIWGHDYGKRENVTVYHGGENGNLEPGWVQKI